MRNGEHANGRPSGEPSAEEHKRKGGLNWLVAGLFIVAQLAGGGIVAMPTAIVHAGLWVGMLLNVMLTVMAASTSIMLGRCWVILRRRWPEVYREHCREPYPEMCLRAVGPHFRRLASVTVQLNQFGISVVFVLLSAKNIQHFLEAFLGVSISFCLLILILAVLLFPFTLLKSPEDFGWAAVVSVFTTAFAVVLILIGAAMDMPVCGPHSQGLPPPVRLSNYFLALGTILFAYGGHPGFPTVQHDMRRPSEFTKSSVFAFAVLALLYLPVCLLGYLAYGNSLRDSVMNSIQHTWIQHGTSFLITGHAIFIIIIVINPINQMAEKMFSIPQEFGMKRVLVRGAVLALVVFVAESVPTFGPLLNLIGGSTQTSTVLIYPCICFLFLEAAERKRSELALNSPAVAEPKEQRVYSKYEVSRQEERVRLTDLFASMDAKYLFGCVFIMVFGLLGGSAATFSAIRELTVTHFVPPCYAAFLFPDAQKEEHIEMGQINCCGPFQNISVHGNASLFCSAPDLHFYD